jgi:hypothetical protein
MHALWFTAQTRNSGTAENQPGTAIAAAVLSGTLAPRARVSADRRGSMADNSMEEQLKQRG